MPRVTEKVFELLFNRFFLQSFNLGEIILHAPTTFQEYKDGYDTKIVGSGSFREILLQFKSATINKKGDIFTVKITPHQHEILKKYDKRTSYYIVPTFRNIEELNNIQENIKSSSDFLKHCICIDIDFLPPQVDFIQYHKPKNHRESPDIKIKTPDDGGIKRAKRSLESQGWIRGSVLLDKFKKDKIGSVINGEFKRDKIGCVLNDQKPTEKNDSSQKFSSILQMRKRV